MDPNELFDDEAKHIFKVFEESKNRAIAAGGKIEDLSWGDTLLNVAAGLITMDLVSRGLKNPYDESVKRALDTICHSKTILEIIRLAEILLDTPGFETKDIVHKNEVPSETLPEDGIMSAEELKRLFDK